MLIVKIKKITKRTYGNTQTEDKAKTAFRNKAESASLQLEAAVTNIAITASLMLFISFSKR